MHSMIKKPLTRFTVRESIQIEDDIASVFAKWNRVEAFPRFMESVRHTKRIDGQRVLWDIDIAGRQIVWEARIVELIPEKLVRWESSWGAPNQGEVHFEDLADHRTRLAVSIEFCPQRAVEHLGARIGLVDQCVRRDLQRFRNHVEQAPREESIS
jgi:uncharacterized membrane protein